MNTKKFKDDMSKASEIIIPHVIKTMFEHGLIDLDKRKDPQYILSLLKDPLLTELIPSIETTILIHNEFIEMAELAIKNNKKTTALVLLATSIEHQFNSFYREILKSKEIEQSDATDIIKNNNFNSKLGWLIKFLSGKSIPDELAKEIKQIIDLRNSIVHYKAKPGKFTKSFKGSSYQEISDLINKLDFDNIFKILEKTDIFLEDILNSQIDSRRTTIEIMLMLQDYKDSHKKT